MSADPDGPAEAWNKPISLTCTLCGANARRFAADHSRDYYRCGVCSLVFADPATHPERAVEKALYDHHRNDPSDEAYRRFLSRLAKPLLQRLRQGMEGLDYGSGPGPTLSVMLEEAGMGMALYDPFYAPDTTVLARSYDFITCTEVVEHFHRPARDWPRLAGLLRPGGWLGVMTCMVPEDRPFAHWHYRNDPTHVSFYSPAVMNWLGDAYGLRVILLDENVTLMQKSD